MEAHRASWLKNVVTARGLMKIRRWILPAIKKAAPNSVCIAVSGVSGAVVGGMLAPSTGLDLFIARKPNDGTHGNVNGESANRLGVPIDYVIVDDLICSGDTVRRIIESVDGIHPGSKCSGIFLYAMVHKPWRVQECQGIPIYYCQLAKDEFE